MVCSRSITGIRSRISLISTLIIAFHVLVTLCTCSYISSSAIILYNRTIGFFIPNSHKNKIMWSQNFKVHHRTLKVNYDIWHRVANFNENHAAFQIRNRWHHDVVINRGHSVNRTNLKRKQLTRTCTDDNRLFSWARLQRPISWSTASHVTFLRQ